MGHKAIFSWSESISKITPNKEFLMVFAYLLP
jgi:hypothetical protein